MTVVVDFRFRPPIEGYRERDVMYRDADRTGELARQCGMKPTPVLMSRRLDDAIAEMDAAGVAIGVVPARRGVPVHGGDVVTNEEIAQLVRAHPGRFVGVAAVDLTRLPDAAIELEALLRRPEFGAAMIEPGIASTPISPDDRSLYPIYEIVRAQGRPISISFGGNAVPDVGFSHPVAIDRVAKDFPDLRIVVAHGAWPWVHQILHVAHRRRNVYLEPGHYVFGYAGWRDYVDAGNGYLSDRILFASTYPYLPLAAAVERYGTLFDERVVDGILGGNARELLGLPAAPRRRA